MDPNGSVTKYVEILAIGTELLMGELIDSNSTFIASELPKLGLTLRSVTKIGDEFTEIKRCISESLSRSDIVITTGGLGPTSDDLTRESIASYCDETMDINETLLEKLKLRFVERGQHMPETNLKQATLIKSASPIPNPNGTAPGWFTEKNKKIIIALPGPSLELSTMWNDTVKSKLKYLAPGIHIITRNIKTHGISEGELDELLTDLLNSKNPYLGIYSKKDGIHLRIIAKSMQSNGAKTLARSMEKQILHRVGSSVWGFDADTPHQVSVNELQIKDLKLIIEESFTSGIISSNILSVKDGHKVFKGSNIILQNESANNNVKLTSDEILLQTSHLETNSTTNTSGAVGFTIRNSRQSTISHENYRDDSQRMKERAASNALISLISFIRTNY